jgi:hypothetical protein
LLVVRDVNCISMLSEIQPLTPPCSSPLSSEHHVLFQPLMILQYICNIELDKLGLLGDDVVLENLEIRKDLLQEAFG